MLNTNYPNLLKTIITHNKGFWRIEAIGRLSKKINKGQTKYEYLKNLITLHEKGNKAHTFFQVTPLRNINKKIKYEDHSRSMSSQTFFVTQMPPKNRRRINKYNHQIYMNEDEQYLYNQIELHPFEVKFMRNRDENQKYFNVQEIKKEMEKNYDSIRSKQIENRPFTSYYKRKLSQNLFGYESKRNSKNISINNYFSNNRNMSNKRKKGYKINFNSNLNINSFNTINSQNWNSIQDKKRIISAYLKDTSRGNLFAEDNELFEKIKKNRNILTPKNKSKGSKTTVNNSTMTDNLISNSYSNIYAQRNILSEKLDSIKYNTKEELNKRIFNSINNEEGTDINILYEDKIFKNKNEKNIDKLNNNRVLKNGKNINKKNYFNSKQSFIEKKFNFKKLKNDNSDFFIDKKSSVIKIK